MGGVGDRTLAWAEPEGIPELRRRFPRGVERPGGRGELLAAVAADGSVPAFVRASALSELQLASLARDRQFGAGRPRRIPTRWCGSVRSTCSMASLAPSSGRSCRHCCPIPVAACASGRPRCWLRSRPQANLLPDRERFERAAAEFIAAQRLNADRPEARSALGNFLARRGQPAEAESEYKAALRLSAQYVPAAINLADLYRQLGREIEGESVLRTALAVSPRDAGLHHVLGLTLVRLKQLDGATCRATPSGRT